MLSRSGASVLVTHQLTVSRQIATVACPGEATPCVTSMREIVLFAEDDGHERFLMALLRRFADQFAVEVRLAPRSVRGGHGKALTELEEFVRAIRRSRAGLPDLIVVAIDGNCLGFARRKMEIDAITAGVSDEVVVQW